MATNGYEQLIAAAKELRLTELLETGEEISQENAARLISANRESLNWARRTLRQACSCPLSYDREYFSNQCDCYTPLRNLARCFGLELKEAARAQDFERAVGIGLTMIDLASAQRRGGLVVDAQVALSLEGIAIDRLRKIRRELNPPLARQLAEEILAREKLREPFQEIANRDAQWESIVEPEEAGGPLEFEWEKECGLDQESHQLLLEALRVFSELPQIDLREIQKQSDDCNLALLRLLAWEASLVSFYGENGLYPRELADLTPDYIPSLPLDPFTGRNFCYRESSAGYDLFSTGPGGIDHGGNFGPWPLAHAGTVDLCLDVFDDEKCLCSVRFSSA